MVSERYGKQSANNSVDTKGELEASWFSVSCVGTTGCRGMKKQKKIIFGNVVNRKDSGYICSRNRSVEWKGGIFTLFFFRSQPHLKRDIPLQPQFFSNKYF